MATLLRILHVIPSIARHHGGPSRAIIAIETALAGRADVTTLTTDDDGPGQRMAQSILPQGAGGAERVYFRKSTEFYKFAPGAIGWLWRNVQRFDVVHIHALFSFTSWIAGRIARARGVPYIVRPLGTLNSYGVTRCRPWLKRLSLSVADGPLLRHASAVHFTSPGEQQEAAKLGIGINGVVIPLGIEGCEAHSMRKSDGIVRILFLARIDPIKNLDVLIQAFAAVEHTCRPVRLVVAGDGPPDLLTELHHLADRLGIADRIDWLGHVEGVRKAAAIASADIYVLPSFSENFGIAAAEAMLAGLPCILTPGVAIAAAAAADGAAVIAEPTPQALAAAITRLLADSDARREIGARARAYAMHEYSMSAMADRLVALYESVRRPDPRKPELGKPDHREPDHREPDHREPVSRNTT